MGEKTRKGNDALSSFVALVSMGRITARRRKDGAEKARVRDPRFRSSLALASFVVGISLLVFSPLSRSPRWLSVSLSSFSLLSRARLVLELVAQRRAQRLVARAR